jgi:tetratricopeptide (TPR) repeat protein
MSRYAALVLVAVLCASFCLTQLSEVDLHWHLLAGRTILEDRQIPRVDAFSHTSAGRPWIDLQWLFQVVVALTHRWAGWPGLDLLKILLIGGGYCMAGMAAMRRATPGSVAALALIAILASQERFTLRPEAASFFLLGLLLVCLRGSSGPRWRLLLVPPLMMIWANMHALFAIGIATVLLVLAGDLIERGRRSGRVGATTADPGRWPVVVAAAAVAATLLTPYGLRGWALPWRLLTERIATRNLYGRSIAEFQAPLGGFGWTTSVTAFAFLVAVVLIGTILHGRRNRPSDLLLLAVFLVLALLARRNIPLFALVALPTAAPAVDAALQRTRVRPRTLTALVSAAAVVLLGGVWSNAFFARDGTQRYFGRGEAPGFYPGGAAGFVSREPIPGEVLNDMTMGGYLAWRWYPARRVFIDGRLEVHDASLYAAYLRLQQNPAEFEEIARRYGVGTVLWSHRESVGAAPLLRYLAGGHGWRPVFADLAAAVFVREPDGGGAPGIPPAIDLGSRTVAERILEEVRDARRRSESEDPAPAWLRRILPRRTVPVAEVSAGLFFGVIGRHENAELLFREALEWAPRNALVHHDLAQTLMAEGRDAEARQSLEIAVGLDGGFAPARAALAHLLAREGDAEGALRQWSIVERSGPLEPGSLRARGALLARRGRIDEAIEDYRRALRIEPERGDMRAALALLYRHNGLGDLAAREIAKALAADPDACVPRVALGRIRQADGDLAGAEGAYLEVLRGDPACAEAHLAFAALLAAAGRAAEAETEATLAIETGLDPADLSSEPALRNLALKPGLRGPTAPGSRAPEGLH